MVLMFPPRDETEKYILLPFFWVPEDTIPRRVKYNSVPYDVWEKQGYILSTEGNVVHYAFIQQFIQQLGEKIDGIVAAIMALDRVQRNERQSFGSVYDERGLLAL